MIDNSHLPAAVRRTLDKNSRLHATPDRIAGSGPRSGASLDAQKRAVGNLFWKSGAAVLQVILTRISERITEDDRNQDPAMRRLYDDRVGEAKKVLQSHRNLAYEAVLPLFDVHPKQPGDEPTLADEHAHGYLVDNLFTKMLSEWDAWIPSLVGRIAAEDTRALVQRLGEVEKSHLSNQLQNFEFVFRKVVAP